MRFDELPPVYGGIEGGACVSPKIMGSLKISLFVLIGLVWWCNTILAEDYSFEIPAKAEAKEAKLEWSGNLDGKYTLFQTRASSPLYGLQFFGAGAVSDYLSQYQLELYLNGDYQRKSLGLHLKSHLNYLKVANATEADSVALDIFELYGNLDLSINSSIQAGKIRYNWGKGYAFNPVGYVNSVKNPENPELAQAGLLSARFETIKSFQSRVLKTAALTAIVIPPQAEIKDRFGEAENTDVAAKLYLMLGNMDCDLLGYYSKANPKRIGADFAVNLKENIELHGEVSYVQDNPKSTIADNRVLNAKEDGYAYLVGLRWLNKWEITTIFEYYHTAAGFTQDEFDAYLAFFRQSLASGKEDLIKLAAGVMQNNFSGNTLMQDYLYLQVQKPEPFDLLYFTPSISAIYNILDKSLLLAINLIYQPVTNFEFDLKPTFMFGKDDSEYGSQRFQQRVEAWLRFYF